MQELEKDIEKKLRKAVENHGGVCLKWVCPGWAGVPDRIVLLPGGRVYFVETKRPKGGRLTRMQEWWLTRLKAMGFKAHIVWNKKDLDLFILNLEEEEHETAG